MPFSLIEGQQLAKRFAAVGLYPPPGPSLQGRGELGVALQRVHYACVPLPQDFYAAGAGVEGLVVVDLHVVAAE